MRYSPSVSVTTVRRIPFSESSTVTLAFGTVPPVGSVTVPRISPDVPVPWACVTLFAGSKHANDRNAPASKVALISPPGSANKSPSCYQIEPIPLRSPQRVSEWARHDRCYLARCRLCQAWQICMEVLQETQRHPLETQGPHAPDGCIQNYDCPYHIILTNVKTKPHGPHIGHSREGR